MDETEKIKSDYMWAEKSAAPKVASLVVKYLENLIDTSTQIDQDPRERGSEEQKPRHVIDTTEHTVAVPDIEKDLSKFCARTPPKVTIGHVFNRVIRYANPGPEGLVRFVIYTERFRKYTGVSFSLSNIHKLTLTGLLLAAKMSTDKFYSNPHFAKVGGMSVKELNHLERIFAKYLCMDLFVSDDELDKRYRNL